MVYQPGVVVPFIAARQVQHACLLVGLITYEVEKTYSVRMPCGQVIGSITEYDCDLCEYSSSASPRVNMMMTSSGSSNYTQVEQILEKTVVRNCHRFSKPRKGQMRDKAVLSLEVDHRKHSVLVNMDETCYAAGCPDLLKLVDPCPLRKRHSPTSQRPTSHEGTFSWALDCLSFSLRIY
jgi:hypothetical protein